MVSSASSWVISACTRMGCAASGFIPELCPRHGHTLPAVHPKPWRRNLVGCSLLSWSRAGCWHKVWGEGAVGDAVQPEQQRGSPQVQGDQWCLKDAGSKHSLLGQWRPVGGLGQFFVISISRRGLIWTPDIPSLHPIRAAESSEAARSLCVAQLPHIPYETWGFCPTQLLLVVIQPS